MGDMDKHTGAKAEPPETPSVDKSLSALEQALFEALDGQFMSMSVVRSRARLNTRDTSPIVSRKMLSGALPLAPILHALHELERRGWAEQLAIGGCTRWRRTRETGETLPPSK